MNTKKFYTEVYEIDHPSGYSGGEDGSWSGRLDLMRERTKTWLTLSGLINKPDAQLLEIGCGMAFLSDIHEGWNGVEYSKTAVDRVKNEKGSRTKIFEADARQLPFEDETIEGIFSWAALEHVISPEIAFQEIDRVLKKGGHALIAPAWNCRPWTVKKLEDRSYRVLSISESIGKFLIPLRELIIVRALIAFPKRLWGELGLLTGLKQPLRYRALSPRWDLIEKYGHVSDDDAVASIDLHAAIIFFKSRGFEINSHPTVWSRLMATHQDLIITKYSK